MRVGKTVLFMIRRFSPQIGGVETHVLKISEELVKKGYTIRIIAESLQDDSNTIWQSRYMDDNIPGKEGLASNSSKIDHLFKRNEIFESVPADFDLSTNNHKKITVYRMPLFKKGRLKKLYIWMWLIKNIKIIHTSDIIHCHDVFFWYLPLRFIFLRKPVFTTFHGYEEFPVPLKNKLIRKISEKLSWGNICVGEYIKKWYGTRSNYITYGGIDRIDSKREKILRSANSQIQDEKSLKILFVGRLEKDLGLNIYIETLKLLKDKGIKFEFKVCGDGILKRKIEQYGMVFGFVNNVGKYLEDTDIVFASSYLSILESIAFRKTVITAYNNSLKEDYLKMTPFNKWINIVNNKYDLLNKVEDLIKNPDLYHKMQKEAYNWVSTQTWKNITVNYINLWNKISK